MSVRFAVLFTVAGITCAAAQSNPTWRVRPPLLPVVMTQTNETIPLPPTRLPIQVQTYGDFALFGYPSREIQIRKLKILSVVESVEIQSITLNRGNCDSASFSNGVIHYETPRVTLKYGDMKEFSTSCGEILEMVIKTNLGDFKFDYNN
jgi:hypothetical protein